MDYLRLDEFEVGDFMNDGSLQLYLDGHGDGIFKKGIYQVVDDDFVEVFNIRSFDQYNDNIKAAINGNNFSMTVQIGEYKKSFTSVLPDKVFYDTRDVKDKKQASLSRTAIGASLKMVVNGWCRFKPRSIIP